MTKEELRKAYLQKRQALSEAEYLHLNRMLCENFFAQVDLSLVKVLHTFLPIAKNKEPDTWIIIDRILSDFPHIQLSIPRVNLQTNQLENFFFEGLHQLKKNKWGILEPKQGIPTESGKIDMILVPLLAFDKLGNRIGYGKGYYDQLLKECRYDCKKIGISLFRPEEEIHTVESHDQKLTMALTPLQTFFF